MIRIGEILTRVKDPINIEDSQIYKRVTIKTKHQGVTLRDEELGSNIGTKKQFKIRTGQFLLSKIDAMFGAFSIVPPELDNAIITGNFWAFDVDNNILNIDWFKLYTSTPEFINICYEASSGTTHRHYLNEGKFLNFQISLPTLTDQKNIVSRHNSLMDKTLFIESELIRQRTYVNYLRQAILQDAVQGKLVPQDSNDEPASELLKKIQAEKEELIEKKKIKTEKPLLPINDEEIPYELPNGWEWVRLGNGTITVSDIDHNMPHALSEGIPYISPLNFISGDNIDFINCKKVSKYDYDRLSKKSRPTIGDIIFPRYGTIGDVRYVNISINFLVSYSCVTIKTSKVNTVPMYVYYYCKSTLVKNEINKYVNKTTQPNVGIKSIQQFLFSLPPLNEQKRIVAKIDQLMKLFDELEESITQAQRDSELLIQALLQEAFGDSKIEFAEKKEIMLDNVS